MINFNRIPAFKALMAISLLFVTFVFFQVSNVILWSLFGLFVVGTLVSFVYKRISISYYFVCFALASVLALNVKSSSFSYQEKIVQDFEGVISGKVIKVLKRADKYTRVIAQANINPVNLPELKNESVLLTVIHKSGTTKMIKPGFEIYAPVNISIPDKAVYPDEFDYQRYMKSLSCNWLAICNEKKLIVRRESRNFRYYLAEISSMINSNINLKYSEKHSPIIEALLTGTKVNIDKSIRESFSKSGTAHLLAVSGLHTGLAAGFIFVILGFLKNQYVRFIIFSIFLLAFVSITGFQPSAIRAGLMIELYFFARLIGRKADPLNIASVVLLGYIIVKPNIIFNISFQMSTLSILGIILLFPIFNKFWNTFRLTAKIPEYIKNSLSVTLAASTVLSPLTSYYFGVFSLVSPFANLILIPIFTLILSFGFFSLIFSFIPIISILYADAASFLIEVSYNFSAWIVSLPMTYISSEAVTTIAFLISILTIYIAFSKKGINLIIRLGVSITVFIIFINQFTYEDDFEKLNIYPRKQFVLCELPAKDKEKMIIINDRKSYRYAKRDLGTEFYLQSLKDKYDTLIIAYTGIVGEKVIENIVDSIPVKSYQIDIHTQLEFEKHIGLPEHFVQRID